jgi:hypothetical protein
VTVQCELRINYGQWEARIGDNEWIRLPYSERMMEITAIANVSKFLRKICENEKAEFCVIVRPGRYQE